MNRHEYNGVYINISLIIVVSSCPMFVEFVCMRVCLCILIPNWMPVMYSSWLEIKVCFNIMTYIFAEPQSVNYNPADLY